MDTHSQATGRFLYGLSVAANSSLLSFVILVVLSFIVEPGERWIGLGLMWFFSMPILVLFGALGTLSFKRYRDQQCWLGAAKVYALTLALVLIGWAATSVLFVALFRLLLLLSELRYDDR